jgi:hypothetical protein
MQGVTVTGLARVRSRRATARHTHTRQMEWMHTPTHARWSGCNRAGPGLRSLTVTGLARVRSRMVRAVSMRCRSTKSVSRHVPAVHTLLREACKRCRCIHEMCRCMSVKYSSEIQQRCIQERHTREAHERGTHEGRRRGREEGGRGGRPRISLGGRPKSFSVLELRAVILRPGGTRAR